ncbi:hypothetical protein P5673_025827 [Acropora cervicornis]|uniref:Uncharacterized protein n=1 Tax=Acropora cervicornis TaxID=6130 RepID=A0AAD9Q1L0_ACRCE|nr:hypothetical protein P5673_025827 [Acropora cervicornis]
MRFYSQKKLDSPQEAFTKKPSVIFRVENFPKLNGRISAAYDESTKYIETEIAGGCPTFSREKGTTSRSQLESRRHDSCRGIQTLDL